MSRSSKLTPLFLSATSQCIWCNTVRSLIVTFSVTVRSLIVTIFPHEIKGKMSKLQIKSAHTVSLNETLPIHESFWIRQLLRKIKNERHESFWIRQLLWKIKNERHESFWIRQLLRKIKNERHESFCTRQQVIVTSGVPQNVLVVPMPSMPSLHKPKSVSVIWPWNKQQLISNVYLDNDSMIYTIDNDSIISTIAMAINCRW
jgi:hypothetical protein